MRVESVFFFFAVVETSGIYFLQLSVFASLFLLLLKLIERFTLLKIHVCDHLSFSSCHNVNTQLCIVYVHYIRLHKVTIIALCVSCITVRLCLAVIELTEFKWFLYIVSLPSNVAFICHTSSGTSGEEEKGQSQEVDQEVSFVLLSIILFVYLGVNTFYFWTGSVRLDLRRTGCVYTGSCIKKFWGGYDI